jgi:NADH dehydrogenase
MTARHRIVIVGGGAGGLELATRLGDKVGKHKADITLVDAALTHVWKPLLHDVAAGALDADVAGLPYIAQARWHNFRFRLGRMQGLDRADRVLHIGPTHDDEGIEIIPSYQLHYDTLVISVGSVSNDFGVKGVQQHCFFLDNTAQAEEFHKQLLVEFGRAHIRGATGKSAQLEVAIIGAGATGSELAAQLHHVSQELSAYGFQIDPKRDLKISVIEAAERILPMLPARLSSAAETQLTRLGVAVHVGQRVIEVTPQGVHTQSGKFIPATISVWAAGIKAPDFLKELDGLESNRFNQLLVRPTLQTTRDDSIFAFGDCAACPLVGGAAATVPPRAQAAHQQASLLVKSLRNRLRGRPLLPYVYRDYGSLVALGKYSTVGALMNQLMRGSVMVEGVIARLVYLSLYKMHQVALFGWYRVVLLTFADVLRRRVYPEIKLH